MSYEEIKSQCDELDTQIEEHKEFNFEEFELDFDVAVGIVKDKLNDKIEVLNAREIVRQQAEKEKKDREEREAKEKAEKWMNDWYENAQYVIDELAFDDIDKVSKDLEEGPDDIPFGYEKEFEQKKSRIKTMLEAKISLLQKEKAQEDERLKFEQEKAEFEQKQRDALYAERSKKLEDIGFYKHFPEGKRGEAKFVDFSDMSEDTFGQYFNGLKGLVNRIENAEVVEMQEVKSDEEIVVQSEEIVVADYSDEIIIVDNSDNVSIQIDPIETFNRHLKPVMDNYPKQYTLKYTKKDGYSLIFKEDAK